ncbi:MAG: hypothetical protein ABSH14_05765 [Verrucomicrobiia bacterium]|jgi:hypothetical protein
MIPLHEVPDGVPMRLGVIVRESADPVGGNLVLLRSSPDTHVYLGCLADAGGRVKEWVEVWVQNLDGVKDGPLAYRESLSNRILDERWSKLAEALRELEPEGFIQTGWEVTHPAPTFLNLAKGTAVHPVDASGVQWELCRDDQLLTSAGLPPYSTSTFRYLHQPALRDKTRFIPVVAGAPVGHSTVPCDSVLEYKSLVPFNPQAGLIIARELSPIGFEDYVDLLAGRAWRGLEHGKARMFFTGAYRFLNDTEGIRDGGAYLFLGQRGRAGRFLEVFHLKLELLLDAIRQVRAFVQHQQLPMLNLSADSFRVRLTQTGSGLPAFWTARCQLAKPGQSCALQVKTSDFRYFLRGETSSATVYFPEHIGANVRGNVTVRIRKVLPADREGLVLEGTLVTEEKLSASPYDLIWIQLTLSSGCVDLYGHPYAAEGLAYGEVRFRTVPQRLSETHSAALRSSEGATFPSAPFEVIPLLSTPCDLYALGVLAVRTLLVDDKAPLAIALDEILSLARQASQENGGKGPLEMRIQSVFGAESRYVASLGSHHLFAEVNDATEAFRLIPSELWWSTLAAIIRLFPGIGPDSHCRDYGDAPSLALEANFDPVIKDFHDLARRSRSLIIVDWTANREIHSVIKSYLEQNEGG